MSTAAALSQIERGLREAPPVSHVLDQLIWYCTVAPEPLAAARKSRRPAWKAPKLRLGRRSEPGKREGPGLEDLPHGVLYLILRRCDAASSCRVFRTCRTLRVALQAPLFAPWRLVSQQMGRAARTVDWSATVRVSVSHAQHKRNAEIEARLGAARRSKTLPQVLLFSVDPLVAARFRGGSVSLALQETRLQTVKLVDVSGVRSLKRKWAHAMELVDSLLFVLDPAWMHAPGREDPNVCLYDEAIAALETVCNSVWFTQTTVCIAWLGEGPHPALDYSRLNRLWFQRPRPELDVLLDLERPESIQNVVAEVERRINHALMQSTYLVD